ncbi:outer membrane protein assembly factor BamB family protein [Sandarakinorhabdus rubra]|uniref:outer membrane protein assembly factor BamB family protein n=1 Tax=Sandarakinorhabdus rubra TaxID=2672568 RepID=UPI001F4597DD|nr:PQQ-binding-like beta-propeller repeat protein [Sandarakinorhabdus rubra]
MTRIGTGRSGRALLLVLAASVALAGCGIFKKGSRNRTPTVGERIPILSFETRAEAEPELSNVAIVLPAPERNADWAQPGGSAAKQGGQLELAANPRQAWRVSIGKGSSKTARLNAAPVVGGGKIFTIDTAAEVRAFDASTGRELWTATVKLPKRGGRAAFGGGVSYGDGRVYVATGQGLAAALDAQTGKLLWERALVQPLRGAPAVSGDRLFVLSQDNQLHALDAATGELRWTVAGTVEVACIMGAGAAAVTQDTVIAGYCSGELNALRAENGRTVWQDQLARTGRSTAMAALADIDASPVVDRGRVFAVGHGGRMIALELATGQRVWERNFASLSTPWAAGEFLYLVTIEGEVLCITRAEGQLRWVSRLDQYRKPKKKKGPIQWTGPVLAGERLWVAGSNKELVAIDPYEGKKLSTIELKAAAYLPPVVAGGTLYLLTDDGSLTAWR